MEREPWAISTKNGPFARWVAQSLLSMELRAGPSLARLWAERGWFDKSLELLAPIHGRFTEGFGTRDVAAAAKLLQELRARSRS